MTNKTIALDLNVLRRERSLLVMADLALEFQKGSGTGLGSGVWVERRAGVTGSKGGSTVSWQARRPHGVRGRLGPLEQDFEFQVRTQNMGAVAGNRGRA